MARVHVYATSKGSWLKMNSDQRIAIISPSFPPCGAGGVTTSHSNLFHTLRKLGVNVRVYTFADHRSCAKNNVEDGINRFGVPSIVTRGVGRLFRVLFRVIDRGAIAYQCADIATSWMGAFRARRAIRRWRPTTIVVPDQGATALVLRKQAGTRFVLFSHHNPRRFLNNPVIGLHSNADARLAIWLERKALRKVDKVVCPSEYMANEFKDTYSGSLPCAVIPNIVDQDTIDRIDAAPLRKKLGLPENAKIVYIPSAGSKIKGATFVCEIVRRLGFGNAPIGFYLSGAIGEELRYQLAFLPRNIRLFSPGLLPYEENLSYVKGCSFGVTPCLIESFGMAILEANFCGLPVVAFDVGGNRAVIENGVNGFLVDYMDVERLVHKARSFLNDAVLGDLRSRTSKYVCEKFASDRIAESVLAFITNKGYENNVGQSLEKADEALRP